MKQEKYWSGFFDNKAVKKKEAAERLTFSSEANRRSLYEAIHFFLNKGFRKVLDAGTGTGGFSSFLNNRADLIVGLDISFEMLRLFKYDDKLDKSNIVLCQASIIYPPFPDATFDLIIASEVLQYVPFKLCIRRLLKVLCNGGILIASVPNKEHPAIKRAHVRRDKMYNGIGTEDLLELKKSEGISYRFSPLFLENNEDKRYRLGKIYDIPKDEDFRDANRFIIEGEKQK